MLWPCGCLLCQGGQQSCCCSSTLHNSCSLISKTLPSLEKVSPFGCSKSALSGDVTAPWLKVMRVLWQVETARSGLTWWSVLQLLLVLLPLVGLLLVPQPGCPTAQLQCPHLARKGEFSSSTIM